MSELIEGGSSGLRIRSEDWITQIIARLKSLTREQRGGLQSKPTTEEGPTVTERRANLLSLYDRYETLVETLCDAAQFGPAARLESNYIDLRRAIVTDYDHSAVFLKSFYRSDRDPILTLIEHETLSEFLDADEGGMIELITESREALVLYGEHLRQLALSVPPAV